MRPWYLVAGLMAATGRAAVLSAQSPDDCFPAKSSNEAKTLAIFSVPLAYGPAGAPNDGRHGRFQLGFEVSLMPSVDSVTAVPTFCRPDKHAPENTDLLFALPRPRLGIALGGGFAIEASWIPPARVAGVKANLVSGSLSYAAKLDGHGTRLVLRAHATLGVINAPITCGAKQIADPVNLVCYQGQVSDDSYHPNVVGGDVAVAWSLGGGRVRPYMGAGYNHLAPRFQVHFMNSDGILDQRRVEVDLDRLAVFGGATWQASRTWAISGEVYSAPSDAVIGRLAIRYGL